MFKLALAQMAHPEKGDVVVAVGQWAEKAARAGAQLLVFPECLMTPFEKTPDEFVASAQTVNGAFASALQSIAQANNLWLVFTMNERNENAPDARPFNTAVIVSSDGKLRGCYRKTHLYTAHGLDESAKMSAGSKLFLPVKTSFCTIGLGICYDLRFPEVARAAALAGCNIMIFPAAWVQGPNKVQHWETLLRARAIENEMFVAGCCRPDRNCIGTSCVADPQGNIIARAGEDEQLVIADVDLDLMTSTRDAMPCLEHRRPALYGVLSK